MRQILFVHGGDSFVSNDMYMESLRQRDIGNPFMSVGSKRWKYSLTEKLGSEYEIAFPAMPCEENAHYEEWAVLFQKCTDFCLDGVILIGHSLGGNFLARFLSDNVFPRKIDQLHLVAASFGAPGGFSVEGVTLNGIEEQVSRIYLYHSTDDPVVKYKRAQAYKEALPSAELITFTDRGHFLGAEFPELLENIKK